MNHFKTPKPIVILLLGLAALLLGGCGNSADNVRDKPYAGRVTIGITDDIPLSGPVGLKNIFSPDVREIVVVVLVDNAKQGTRMTTKWYQMGLIQTSIPDISPVGKEFAQASAQIRLNEIDVKTGVGAGRMSITTTRPLPEDSYMVEVYVEGRLARTIPFVVSGAIASPPPSRP